MHVAALNMYLPVSQDLPRISQSLTHFWSSLPDQLTCLLAYPCVVTIIGVCDNILYQTALKASHVCVRE